MKIIALIMLLIASPVQAGWFGPDNYDDCILENVKPDMAKHAVYAVKSACRSKFPKKTVDIKHFMTDNYPKATLSELKKITIKYHNDSNMFEVYNGNGFTVNNVKVEFNVKSREHPIIRYLSELTNSYDEFLVFFYLNPMSYSEIKNVPINTISYLVLSAEIPLGRNK